MTKRQGIIKTIRKFKWGNILIVNIKGYYYQVVDTNKTEVNINDFVLIEGRLRTPQSLIKDPSVKEKEILAEKIEILIEGNSFDENTEIYRLNNIKNVLIWKSEVINNFNQYFNNFINIQTPKLLTTASEGGAAVFKTEGYVLSQSPQLYKQMMCVNLNMPVKEIAVCFRNEPFNSSKHIPEFTSLDCELPLTSPNVKQVYDQALGFLMNLLDVQEAQVISLQSTKMKSILNRKVITDLSRTDELEIFKHLGSELIVVTNYDNNERAFYTYKDQSFDILYKGVEICSGSVRIFNYDEYLKAFEERGLNPENFKDYLDTFKTRSIYTGGFAIGLDRLTALYFDITNIRDAKI